MKCTADASINAIRELKTNVISSGIRQQKKKILTDSPYSGTINQEISSYEEFRLYHRLRLREAIITRPALIKEIDLDLWISSEGCTNRDLMLKGSAPYAYDAADGKIELHHIGQKPDAPFAELTFCEHMLYGNNKLIHTSEDESWRNDPKAQTRFLAERSSYWKKRVKGEYTVIQPQPFCDLPEIEFELPDEIRGEIKDAIETLFSECAVSDLEFLSDLAKSYSLIKQTGASSMSEFLLSLRTNGVRSVGCPFCNSTEYTQFGTYQKADERIQRYRCKTCGKAFSLTSRSLISGSSFSYMEWIKFIDCLYNGYTLKQMAAACGISEQTAHENRIKVFYALKLLDDQARLRGNIVIDETFLPVSYKGNHSQQEDYVLPRAARKRGGENHEKGLSKNLVCIACALDENGNSVAHVAGVGNSSARRLSFALAPSLQKDAVECIYSDKSTSILSFAEDEGYRCKQAVLLRKNATAETKAKVEKQSYPTIRYIQRINSYHSRLKKFLGRFSGISTKLLSGYLYLFAWKERNKDRDPVEAYKELLTVLTEPNHNLSAEDIVQQGLLPDALDINHEVKKASYPNLERNLTIYQMYAEGSTMAEIAKEFCTTRQNISLIIKQLREEGYAYRTKKDEERERKAQNTGRNYLSDKQLRYLERDAQIYAARKEWSGSPNEFYQVMMKEHHLGKNRIKNIISWQKDMEKLRKEIFIYEDVSYRSLKEVYTEVFAKFCSLQNMEPERSAQSCFQALAAEYNFTEQNIQRIIRIMTEEDPGEYFAKKRKLSKTETYNRNKAIFIDFLKWPGGRNEFCPHIAGKYGLSATSIYQILHRCLYADTKRLDLL